MSRLEPTSMYRILPSLLAFLVMISGLAFGNVTRQKDSSGKTLQQVRDAYFARCLKHNGKTAKFTTIGSQNKPSVYYQLNNPYYKTTRNLFLTEADKLNGITLKTTSFVKSSSYRQQRANTNSWSEWHSGTPAFASWLTVYINMKNGKFEIIPVSSSKYILKKASPSKSNFPKTLRDLTKKSR